MDTMVEKTQKWLNANYAQYGTDRFPEVVEDGETGWGTINGLIRALQIELGIQETADNFGAGTIARFNQQYPNGISEQTDSDKSESNVYGIIQGGLWCKGYSTGSSEITKHFYSGTGSGIKSLKTDAGVSASNSTVTLNVMKALLSMDQFVTLVDYGGTETITKIQRTLNSKYESYIGLSPCDGLYGRQMNESMIKVLQAIEGYSVEDATGNFGDGTKANLVNILVPGSGDSEALLLARYALCCNGYTVNYTSTSWDSEMASQVTAFQSDLALPQTGTVDVNTWMSLLLSKGNPDRACDACDTRFEITDYRMQHLNAKGYSIVGRYLTGGDFKELRKGEAQRIIATGKKLFPIFQESGSDSEYFNTTNAAYDAESAAAAAMNYGIKSGKGIVIYFAVDFDAQDTTIESVIQPYFHTLQDVMKNNLNNAFKIGVYGTRNVCERVINIGYAETAFVSDMSTGYSGNMGYKIPSEWTFDQFSEYTVDDDSGKWGMDKVAFSGYAQPIDASQLSNTPLVSYCVQTIRDNRQNMYLEEISGVSNGRDFRVLSNEIYLTISYSGDTAHGTPHGVVRLMDTDTSESLYISDIGNGQTNSYTIPIAYANTMHLNYTSKVDGYGLVDGSFTTYLTSKLYV